MVPRFRFGIRSAGFYAPIADGFRIALCEANLWGLVVA